MSATWEDLKSFLYAQAQTFGFDLTRYQHPMTHQNMVNLPDFLEVVSKGVDSWWDLWNVGHGGGIDADTVDGKHYTDLPTTLSGLDDVYISSIQHGDTIAWDSFEGRWENTPGGGGDNYTVKADAGDPTPGFLDAKVANSIVVSGTDKLQLSGDAASPGNSKYYGTNSGGTKGFYDVPVVPYVPIASITFNASNVTWIDMPAALTEFLNQGYHRIKYDLSKLVRARISVYVKSPGSASSAIRAQYSTDESTWYYLDGSTGPSASISSAGVKTSSWVTLTGGSQADVFLRIVGINGDGATDPAFGLLALQLTTESA